MTAGHTDPTPAASQPLTVGLLRQLLAGVSGHLTIHVAIGQTDIGAGNEADDEGSARPQPVVGLGVTTAGQPGEELVEDAVLLWCTRHASQPPVRLRHTDTDITADITVSVSA
jgi:hypothetical protein